MKHRTIAGLFLWTLVCALPLNAQTRAPGFGGGAVFLSPHAAFELGRVRAHGELELGWGQSSLHQASVGVSTLLPYGLRVAGNWNGSSASAELENNHSNVFGATLHRGRVHFGIARRITSTALSDYTSELEGFDFQFGLPLGTPLDLLLNLNGRTSNVVERGDMELVREFVVAGYTFESIRRTDYLAASSHRDLEIELSGAFGWGRVAGLIGHGISTGTAPNRAWAFARVTAPIAPRVELLAEAGRNSGVPAIARVPQNFARVGLRLNLRENTENNANREKLALPRASIEFAESGTRLAVSAVNASAVDVKGDFTAWEIVPMKKLSDGRWYVFVSEGVLQFNIRVDGRDWTVPAGVPTITDEFSGARVAVVVVSRPSEPIR